MRQLQHLYLVKCSDGAIYCAGPQKGADGDTVPGGPLAYENREHAQRMADALGGTIKSGMLWPLKGRCIEIGVVLWVRHTNGTHSFFPDTVPEIATSLERIVGDERRAALRASGELPTSVANA